MRRALRTGALVLAAALVATGCSDGVENPTAADANATATASPSADPTPTVPELSITGLDYAFQVSGTPTAGMTKISFKNDGKEEHMTGLGKLQPGKTLADVQTALKTGEQSAFGAVFDEAEGDKDAPQLLSPGYAASTYTNLSEGTYALICFIPSPDGKSHYEKGMLAELEVAAAAGTTAAAPEPDFELSFKGGKLTGPATVPAGKSVFKVTTDANHELIGVIGLGGKTAQQGFDYFTAKFEGKAPAGPPHGAAVLQLHDFEPADQILVEMDLSPGEIMFICPLETDGKPAHTEKLTITVT